MSKSNLILQPATLAAQALGWIDPTTRAITAPINLSTTLEREPDQSLPGGRSYIRPRAASFDQPEALLAALEGGPAAMLFASGMAAATAVFQILKPDDHAIAPEEAYWGLKQWLMDFGRPSGLEVDFVDMSDTANVAAAVKPGRTKLIWAETPSNPRMKVCDLAVRSPSWKSQPLMASSTPESR